MKIADLPRELPSVGFEDGALPRNLLGAYRRKSITCCTGVTNETTIVYWFRSRSFAIDAESGRELAIDGGQIVALEQRQRRA